MCDAVGFITSHVQGVPEKSDPISFSLIFRQWLGLFGSKFLQTLHTALRNRSARFRAFFAWRIGLCCADFCYLSSQFLSRDAMHCADYRYAVGRCLSVRPSVCLSVYHTPVLRQVAKYIIKHFTPSDMQ